MCLPNLTQWHPVPLDLDRHSEVCSDVKKILSANTNLKKTPVFSSWMCLISVLGLFVLCCITMAVNGACEWCLLISPGSCPAAENALVVTQSTGLLTPGDNTGGWQRRGQGYNRTWTSQSGLVCTLSQIPFSFLACFEDGYVIRSVLSLYGANLLTVTNEVLCRGVWLIECVFVVGGYIGVQWVLGINEVECEQCSCQPPSSS